MQLDFGPFCKNQGVIDVDAKVPDGVLDLAVPQQNLDSAQITRGLIDHRCLGPPKRVRAVFPTIQPNGRDPLVNQPRILSRAEVAKIIHAAWKHVIVDASATSLKPL